MYKLKLIINKLSLFVLERGLNTQSINEGINLIRDILLVFGGGWFFWGIIKFASSYADDNPAEKSRGIQFMAAGVAVALVGFAAPTILTNLFNID